MTFDLRIWISSAKPNLYTLMDWKQRQWLTMFFTMVNDNWSLMIWNLWQLVLYISTWSQEKEWAGAGVEDATDTPWNWWWEASGSQVSEERDSTWWGQDGILRNWGQDQILKYWNIGDKVELWWLLKALSCPRTSCPMLARVLYMMSGQAREGILELRAISKVNSFRGRPFGRDCSDSFLEMLCYGFWLIEIQQKRQ